MTETLETLTAKVMKVSDVYARNCSIRRDDDWYLLKLQEELGELTAEYLRLSGRGRIGEKGLSEARACMAAEAADVLAHLLLFARRNKIDLGRELASKWFKHLE